MIDIEYQDFLGLDTKYLILYTKLILPPQHPEKHNLPT